MTEEKLRFDFNAKKALTAQQLLDVEEMMNEIVTRNWWSAIKWFH